MENTQMHLDPLKISAALAAGAYIKGAFDNQPTDIYMPGYNMGYLDFKRSKTWLHLH
jgi:hypothetical protein